jgi:hypothetical protein
MSHPHTPQSLLMLSQHFSKGHICNSHKLFMATNLYHFNLDFNSKFQTTSKLSPSELELQNQIPPPTKS